MPLGRIVSSSGRLLKSLLAGEAFAGILLIAVAALAIVIANSPLAQAYHHLFHAPLAWSPIAKLDTAHLWINDALMAVFFFVVGLEVKREMVSGNLADARVRRLPVLAAAAGMALPRWSIWRSPAASRRWSAAGRSRRRPTSRSRSA